MVRSRHACVIVDMPFGSYQESPEIAFRNAAYVMKEVGCAGIKLEGGIEMAETISFLTERGIPVLAHVGLLPQSINTAGGFRSHGRGDEEADRILADAIAVANAGAFASHARALRSKNPPNFTEIRTVFGAFRRKIARIFGAQHTSRSQNSP